MQSLSVILSVNLSKKKKENKKEKEKGNTKSHTWLCRKILGIGCHARILGNDIYLQGNIWCILEFWEKNGNLLTRYKYIQNIIAIKLIKVQIMEILWV